MKFIKANILIIIIGISCLARVAAAVSLGNQVVELPGTADQLSYHTLAVQIIHGKGFTFPVDWWPLTKAGEPTAHWSYLYTFYLVLVYWIFGINPMIARIIQAVVVGILHPWLAYRVAELTFSRKIGIMAAAITAGYAYFIYYSATLMTEPFYITSILAVLVISIELVNRKKSDNISMRSTIIWGAVLGISLVFALLLRQLFLLFIPFLFLWIIVRLKKKSILLILVSVAIIIVSILPFTLFNYKRFSRFVLLNTNAGYAFFWGNHPYYGTRFISILPGQIYLDLVPNELRHLDEAALDQELLKLGLKYISEDPARYLLLSLSRIPVYFQFWPTSESGLVSNITRVFSFGIMLPFMVHGLFLALRGKSRFEIAVPSTLLILLFIIIYSGIHVFTWTLIRYRLPVDAVLVIFAGYSMWKIWEMLPKRRLSHKIVSEKSILHN